MKQRPAAIHIVYLVLAAISAAFSPFVSAQSQGGHASHTGHKKVAVAPSYAWKLIPPLGLREPAEIDTLLDNYCRQAIPSEVSDAWATTGNYGAEGINMLFDQRPAMSDFFFRDALETWYPTEAKMKFYNTRQPMTLLSYNASGGRETAQERLKAIFSGNINAKAQVGANLDYIYSKGSYANQAAKGLIWGFNGSYLGDRYEFQGYYNHYNLVNKENGGITDPLYITDPAEVQGGVSSINAKSIPTRLSHALTRLKGSDLYINNRYKVGYWHEEHGDSLNPDSVTRREYIAVSTFIHTLKYKDNSHRFLDSNAAETADFFTHTYLDPSKTRDVSSYWSLSNTVGVSMIEGFHRLAKFGLAAYATYEVRRYKQTPDTLDHSEFTIDPMPEYASQIKSHETQSLLRVGAQLTKQRGSLLTYEATAEFGLVGAAAGDIRVEGNIGTKFPVFGDSLRIGAFARFTNTHAPYLMNNYLSNHFIWHNNFGKERRVNFGGEVAYRKTDTHLRMEVTNLQNYIYFGPDFLPRQNGGSVQVFSASLQQNLKVGILHWDNSLTYQTTSDASVIPLPALTVYSNLYLRFRFATMDVQLGVDCDYYTRYYGLNYQPATASFATQNEVKVGNYPFCNAYANMKIKKARFYVLFSHVNQGLFGGKDYFSVPLYPLNPRRFQIGISVDFAN